MIRIGSSGGQMPGNYPQDGVKVPARGDNMVASAGSLIKSGLIYQSGIYVKLMMENGKWQMYFLPAFLFMGTMTDPAKTE